MIKNAKRIKPIEEFIDKNHNVADKYYKLIEKESSSEQLKKSMKRLIAEDPFFFDSYLILADVLFDEGKDLQAKNILREAFRKAMMRIVNKDGATIWVELKVKLFLSFTK